MSLVLFQVYNFVFLFLNHVCLSQSDHVFNMKHYASHVPLPKSVRSDNLLLRSLFVDAVEVFHYYHIYFASSFLIQHVFYFVVDLFHFAFFMTRR
uniref:Putative secreted protein n=1 Tax=Xenopsylla cheopis TaxID=163159 RepID=A0A6M2DWG3_XENCH